MRFTTIVAAATLAAVTACAGGDATTTAAPTTAPTTQAPSTSTTSAPTTTGETVTTTVAPTTVAPTTAAPTTTTTTTTAAPGVVIDVVVEGGEVVGRVERVQANEGDQVTVRVITDTADEVHVHGIDIFFDATPGENVFMFVADLRGIFEIEFEQSGLLLAELQVS